MNKNELNSLVLDYFQIDIDDNCEYILDHLNESVGSIETTQYCMDLTDTEYLVIDETIPLISVKYKFEINDYEQLVGLYYCLIYYDEKDNNPTAAIIKSILYQNPNTLLKYKLQKN